jgi:hypothetical protein
MISSARNSAAGAGFFVKASIPNLRTAAARKGSEPHAQSDYIGGKGPLAKSAFAAGGKPPMAKPEDGLYILASNTESPRDA